MPYIAMEFPDPDTPSDPVPTLIKTRKYTIKSFLAAFLNIWEKLILQSYNDFDFNGLESTFINILCFFFFFNFTVFTLLNLKHHQF